MHFTLLSLDKKNYYQFFDIHDLFLVSKIVPEAFSNPKQAKTLKSSKEYRKSWRSYFKSYISQRSEILELSQIRYLIK